MSLVGKGRVLLPMQVTPINVNFRNVTEDGGDNTQKVTLKRGDGGPVTPKLKPVDTEGVEAKLIEIKPGEHYELDVTVTAPLPKASLRTTLVLETGLADAPTISIPVYARTAPRVTVVPQRFTIPAKRNSDITSKVYLNWADKGEHKILSAEVNDPELSIKVEEPKNDKGKQMVILTVPLGFQQSKGTRYATIHTDDAKSPKITVPITFSRARTARSPGASQPRTRTLPAGKPKKQ